MPMGYLVTTGVVTAGLLALLTLAPASGLPTEEEVEAEAEAAAEEEEEQAAEDEVADAGGNPLDLPIDDPIAYMAAMFAISMGASTLFDNPRAAYRAIKGAPGKLKRAAVRIRTTVKSPFKVPPVVKAAEKAAAKAAKAEAQVVSRTLDDVAQAAIKKYAAATEKRLAQEAAKKAATALASKSAVVAKAAAEVAQKTAVVAAEKVALRLGERIGQKAATEATGIAAKVLVRETTKAAAKVAEKAALEAAGAAGDIVLKGLQGEAADAAAKAGAMTRVSKAKAAVSTAANKALKAAKGAKAASVMKSLAKGPWSIIISVIAMVLQDVLDLGPEDFVTSPGWWSFADLPDWARTILEAIPFLGDLLTLIGYTFEMASGCPEGKENENGLCYTKCGVGHDGGTDAWMSDGCTQCYRKYPSFENNGMLHTIAHVTKRIAVHPASDVVHLEDCPSGWHDEGLTCREDIDTHGSPWMWKWTGGRVVGRLDHGGKCEHGLTYFHGLCYQGKNGSPCQEDGYVMQSAGLCAQRCPPGSVDIGVGCQRERYDRGVGEIPFMFRIRSRPPPDADPGVPLESEEVGTDLPPPPL